MSQNKMVTLSLALASTLTLGCSQSHCADSANSSDSDCEARMETDMGMPAFKVMPTRIPLHGGISLSISAGSSWANRTVSLTNQNNITVPLGNPLDGAGNLMQSIKDGDLSMLGTGPVTIAITGRKETVQARIYLQPQFPDKPTSLPYRDTTPDCSTGGCMAYPASLGIFSKKILSVNYFDQLALPMNLMALQSYDFDGSNLNGPQSAITKTQRFNNTPNGLAITDSAMYMADNFGNAFELYTCTDATACMTPSSPGTYGFTSVTSLSTNVLGSGKIYAGIFDTSIAAYTQPDLRGSNVYKQAQPDLDAGPVLFVAVGELNGDSKGDLIIWHTNGKISVYSSSETKILDYDTALSSQLQAAQTATGITPTAAAVGDFDGDGLDDIILSYKDKIFILLNQENGTFTASPTPTVTVPSMFADISSIATGNVYPKGQKTNIIAFGSQSKKTIAILKNTAN